MCILGKEARPIASTFSCRGGLPTDPEDFSTCILASVRAFVCLLACLVACMFDLSARACSRMSMLWGLVQVSLRRIMGQL